MENAQKRFNILLLEDSARRLKLVRQSLEKSKTRCRLHSVGPGLNSLQYLRQVKPYQDAPAPDLVIWDFTRHSSRELKFMLDLRAAEEFRLLPLVVLTRPETEEVLEEATLSADCGMAFAPIKLDEFLATMNARRIERFAKAVALLADVGFVLVRAPQEFSAAADSQLSAKAG